MFSLEILRGWYVCGCWCIRKRRVDYLRITPRSSVLPQPSSITTLPLCVRTTRKSWSFLTPGSVVYFCPRSSHHWKMLCPSTITVLATLSQICFRSSIKKMYVFRLVCTPCCRKYLIWSKLCVTTRCEWSTTPSPLLICACQRGRWLSGLQFRRCHAKLLYVGT